MLVLWLDNLAATAYGQHDMCSAFKSPKEAKYPNQLRDYDDG
jgi:hypothetical protein